MEEGMFPYETETVDGESRLVFEPDNVKAYLDWLIQLFRTQRGEMEIAMKLIQGLSPDAREAIVGLVAVDILQSLRVSLYNEKLA